MMAENDLSIESLNQIYRNYGSVGIQSSTYLYLNERNEPIRFHPYSSMPSSTSRSDLSSSESSRVTSKSRKEIETQTYLEEREENTSSSLLFMKSEDQQNNHHHLGYTMTTSNILSDSNGNPILDQMYEFQPSISRALEFCHRKVLPPYKNLLLLLGWYPMSVRCFNSRFSNIILNLTHVSILVSIIAIGHILQYVSCFRQDNLLSFGFIDWNHGFLEENFEIHSITSNHSIINFIHKYSPSENLSKYLSELNLKTNDLGLDLNNQIHMSAGQFLFHCRCSTLSHYFLPGLMHLISFLIILKHLRYCDVDRFHNLCLSDQLLSTKIIGHKKTCKKIRYAVHFWLRIIGIFFILILIQLTIHLFVINDLSMIVFEIKPGIIILLKSICLILFAFVELIHISIIIIYALHCQMNIIFIEMNITAMREKRIDFQEFAKNTETFKMNINFLNNRFSLSVSLLMIYILAKASAIFIKLIKKYVYVRWDLIVVSGSSLIYWTILLTIPLLQAARLTNSCQSINDIGHELCARPFCYQQTARDDLDSVLTYTSSLNLKASLLMIPVRPSCIISIVLLMIFIILILSQLQLIDI
uniref:Uncharacterized protein n=1 Tax=Sarcoptes scabiei TaxID=52283 RepID=A0A834R3S2_SARSC